MRLLERARSKAIAFRLGAILVGLAPLVCVEIALRLFAADDRAPPGDPFVSFAAIRPLFVASVDGSRYETAPERLEYFRPVSFSAKKSPDCFRVFCLGGSTVQGRPWGVETSMTAWLELSLRAAEPERNWEVVNCGGVSHASYRVAPILEEVLQYEPDLIVLYTGHNEFLEQRTYPNLVQFSGPAAEVYSLAYRSKLFCAVRTGYLRWTAADSPSAAELPAEVDALLDYQGALADYHRDDGARRQTVEHFRFNLQRMARLAGAADVPMIWIDPAENLKDSPPFKIEASNDLGDEGQRRFNELMRQADEQVSPAEMGRLLREAAAIDPRHAGVRYRLGLCLYEQGRYADARREFVAAKDEDVCPLRIIEPLHEAIRTSAEANEIPLVDVRALFDSASPHGIAGAEMLVDHVHPSIFGHQKIAQALQNEMERLGYVRPSAGWQSRRDRAYREHYNQLDVVYFERGKQRLEGLTRWSQGRSRLQRGGAKKPPPDAEPVKP